MQIAIILKTKFQMNEKSVINLIKIFWILYKYFYIIIFILTNYIFCPIIKWRILIKRIKGSIKFIYP